MPTEFSAGRVRKIYKFIDAHRDVYTVKMMFCRVLEVTRAGFYAWCKRPLIPRHSTWQWRVNQVGKGHAAC